MKLATTEISRLPPKEITLLYAVSDGLHFFKSDDLPGFLVVDRNLNKLYCDLEEQIAWFVSRKFNSKVSYKLEANFAAFLENLELSSVFDPHKITAIQASKPGTDNHNSAEHSKRHARKFA